MIVKDEATAATDVKTGASSGAQAAAADKDKDDKETKVRRRMYMRIRKTVGSTQHVDRVAYDVTITLVVVVSRDNK